MIDHTDDVDAVGTDKETDDVNPEMGWETDEGHRADASTWRVVASFILSLAGLGVSIYLTIAHFDEHVRLSCPLGGGTITCGAVTTSAQSYFLRIPVALLGLIFYVTMMVLNLPPMWRTGVRAVHVARLGAISIGMAFALYLVSAELLIINHICIWCTTVHIVTFFLFVLIVTTVPAMLGWRTPGGTVEDDEGCEPE